MPATRNMTVDILRGLAIFLMVPANMSAFVYAEPHAFWFRLATSFAAPLFIALAGAMIAVTNIRKKHGWRHHLLRGAMLLGTAAMLDIAAWKIWPSYDVLYLIGLSCPAIHFFTRAGTSFQFALVAMTFLATPLLQWGFGYEQLPTETFAFHSVDGDWQRVPIRLASMAKRVFVDGWFPVFPWLGLGFSGALIGRLLIAPAADGGVRRKTGIAAIALSATGVSAWLACPGEQYTRGGYSELFYPPTLGFSITAIGVVLALLWAVNRNPGLKAYIPLYWLGECSLFIYILHLPMILYVIYPRYQDKALAEFLAICFCALLFLIGTAGSVRQLKKRWPKRPLIIRFFLGA